MYSIPFCVEGNSASVFSRAPVPGNLFRLTLQSAFFPGIAEQISSKVEFRPSLVICFKQRFQDEMDERKPGI